MINHHYLYYYDYIADEYAAEYTETEEISSRLKEHAK